MADTENITRTPAEWSAIKNITILDPDGWDRRNLAEDWAKPLTESEFDRKASHCTIRTNRRTPCYCDSAYHPNGH
jgi:hypothetical protein